LTALVARGGILCDPHDVELAAASATTRRAGRATRRRAGASTGDGAIAKEFPVPGSTKRDYGPIPPVRSSA
jgi:hypothetical protein